MNHDPRTKLGARVRLRVDVERFPDFIAPAGYAGTITTITDETIGVTLDIPVPGLEAWNNEVRWDLTHAAATGEDVNPEDVFLSEVEFLDA